MNPHDTPDSDCPPDKSDPLLERLAFSQFDRIADGVLSHLLCMGLSLLTLLFGEIFLLSWLVIGLSQLVFAVPLMLYFKKQKRPLALKGVLIMMGITFLLNGGCFILVFNFMPTS